MNFLVDVATAPFVCVGWIIVGIVAGALARRITGSPDRSFVSDMILGLLGAAIGGMLAGLLPTNVFPGGGLSLVCANLVVATIGAAILITLKNMLFRRGK